MTLPTLLTRFTKPAPLTEPMPDPNGHERTTMAESTIGWRRMPATTGPDAGATFADRHQTQLEETIGRLVAAGALDEATPRVLDGLIDAWLQAELAGLVSEHADRTASMRRNVDLAEARVARLDAEVESARLRLQAAEESLAAAVTAYRSATGPAQGLRAAA